MTYNTIGLTGGIAAGKTYIANKFKDHGIPVVSTDQISREIVKPNSVALEMLVDQFGKVILDNGELNRRYLANLMFSDKAVLKKVNDIMFPEIFTFARRKIQELHFAGNKIVVCDSAIIVEANMQDIFYPLIVVTCPIEIRLSRLIQRDNMSLDKALERINSQIHQEEKVKYANFIIESLSEFDVNFFTSKIKSKF